MVFLGYNGLFSANFQVPTLVQIFFMLHCLWTGVMGVLCTYDPTWSCITENGMFTQGKEKFQNPNVRCAWNVRGGAMFIVAAGALFLGTRETYLIAMASSIWRESYDCIEMLLCKKDGYKMVLRIWMSPIGPMPPLLSFLAMNMWAFYVILSAA
mmetsp:Transcript_71311/g.126017  ORF Transcript_71311/g.126017 Transcript_71311/m.126017 type:complete len:154 (-) Transcript_71311:93-554(-)|eukprot:CAMPEP_0197661900 /NCGR_PEP_ID=MMETSP1338-20131121/51740_1 /TAXON_ID=43686 ORGANISM="Pelagodinium beii, Strain RCC1491" /NCGR_SAMPLE_ID=MMETSP1338 /ASSEMBLY_ACC=CAM_ASM_000754 /LENGTH=153 /DNA_ID=CAMNT_0043239549 /DNA_START=80 /DNA_END=541 /DNA_ORIENTATION=+